MTKKEFGAYIKSLREKAGYSQLRLGLLIGLDHPQAMSNWERGCGSIMPAEKARKMCDVLGFSMREMSEFYVKYESAYLEKYIKTIEGKWNRK